MHSVQILTLFAKFSSPHSPHTQSPDKAALWTTWCAVIIWTTSSEQETSFASLDFAHLKQNLLDFLFLFLQSLHTLKRSCVSEFMSSLFYQSPGLSSSLNFGRRIPLGNHLCGISSRRSHLFRNPSHERQYLEMYLLHTRFGSCRSCSILILEQSCRPYITIFCWRVEATGIVTLHLWQYHEGCFARVRAGFSFGARHE